jgi:alanyl-tRNA synthetase
MSMSKYISDFVRSFKITYTISNLFNYSKLKKNAAIYKKYGLKKSVISPISSKDFIKLPAQPLPWLDEKSLNASNLIREASPLIQGGGGGQAFFATAGGKNAAGLEAALKLIAEKIGI